MSSTRSRLIPFLVLLLALLPLLPPPAAAAKVTPVPIAFPRDDGPHDVPMEWWYVTGHLFTESGDRYGFQMVVFKGQRDDLVGYAAHAAIVDDARGTFRYDEKLVLRDSVSTEVPGGGYDLRLDDWRMRGANGNDHLVAQVPGYAFDLRTTSAKPAALHDGDGFVDYGADKYSYYYSRTRMETTGTLEVDGQVLKVHGEAWMDHQWGDFTTWDNGGWDWFALQLDDGSDLMLYVIYAPDGTPGIVDGSLVAPDGTVTALGKDDFTATPTGSWRSPATGTEYPSGWKVELPSASLSVAVMPDVPDQELDTTRSTGQIYWEGQVTVEGTRDGQPIDGLGYVELTGYARRTTMPDAYAPMPATPPAGD